jgi:hypothetical protein
LTQPTLFGEGELPEAWSVAQVNRHAKNAVEGIFRESIWVHGELVEFKAWRSGHWYFTLRDADASLRCVLWKQQALAVMRRLEQLPGDGMEVLVRGRPTLWEERGEYRLTASDLVPTALVAPRSRRTASSIPPASAPSLRSPVGSPWSPARTARPSATSSS